MRGRTTLSRRDGWLAAVTLAGFALVALASRARPAQQAAGAAGGREIPRQARATANPQGDQLSNGHPQATHHLRLPWSLIESILLATVLLAVIGLAVALWPRLPGSMAAHRRRRRPVEPAADDLLRQVSQTLRAAMSQLASGQVRDGVILCWRRLEQAAEAAGLPRSAAETSSELAGRLLASLPLSEAPLNRLAELYREARFSSHPIPAEAVARARADLAQLRAELEAAAPASQSPARADRG